MSSQVEQLIATKLLEARREGSPVAPSDKSLAASMAAIARRRWNSFERRQGNSPAAREDRIADLAKGLATRFTDGGWTMVGRLISDYRWLSEQIAPILASDESRLGKDE